MDSSKKVLLCIACFTVSTIAGSVLAVNVPSRTNQLPRCSYEEMEQAATQPTAPNNPEKLAHHVMKHCQSSAVVYDNSDGSWHLHIIGPPTKFFYWETALTIRKKSTDSEPTLTDNSRQQHF